MKLKAIAVFVIVVLGASGPHTHKQRSGPDTRDSVIHDRAVVVPNIMEIADPVDVSLSPGIERPVTRSTYPIALAVPTVLLAGFWLYCLLRAAQALRACMMVSRTRPWFLKPQPIPGRVVLLALILCAWQAQATHASDIYFDYSVSAGGNLYQVGDEVFWEISASVEGDTRGIRDLSVSLYESRNEDVDAPLTATGFRPEHQRVVTAFVPLDYFDGGPNVPFYFSYHNYFEVSGGGHGGVGGVSGLGVARFVDHTHPKFLEALDKTGGSLCEGKYTVTKTGFHGLGVGHNYGSVWIDESGNVQDIGIASSTGHGFYVTETEDADIGTTNMSTLSVISESWDNIDCDDSNDFCDGADVNEDCEVNDLDVSDLFYDGGSNISVEDDSFVYQDVIVPTGAAEIKLMAVTSSINDPEYFSVLSVRASNFSNLGRTLIFAADNGEIGDELYSLKGSSLKSFDINEGDLPSSPHLFTKHGKSVYFVAKDNGNSWYLYEFNRELAEPSKITETPLYTESSTYRNVTTDFISLISFAGELYYTVIKSDFNRELWSLDPLTQSPHLVARIGAPVAAPHHFTAAGDILYFVVYDRFSGYSLWRCNGDAAESIRDFGWNEPSSLTAVGDKLFFATLDGLWISDGTNAGTIRATTVKVEADPMQPLCVWNDAVFFAAYDQDTGIELWTSVGTMDGTHIIADITEGPESSLPMNLKALHDGVYFSTTTGPNQACLWRTDGTDEGTEMLADFSTSDGSPIRLHQFKRFMGRSLYFLANDRLLRYKSTTGEILGPVGCDGSIPPGNILHITTASDKLILITDAGDAGQGLWLYGSEY